MSRSAIAGIALVVGTTLLLGGCAAPAPAPEAVEEVVAETDAPQPAGKTAEEIIAEFEIPAGLSTEELAQAYVERLTAWNNYGADPSIKEDDRHYVIGLEALASEIAERNGSSIVDALYSDGYEDAEANERMIQKNALLLRYYVATLKDEEPYREWTELASVSEASRNGSQRVVRVTAIDFNNADKNRLNEDLGSTFESGSEFTFDITFDEADGTAKIANIVVVGG